MAFLYSNPPCKYHDIIQVNVTFMLVKVKYNNYSYVITQHGGQECHHHQMLSGKLHTQRPGNKHISQISEAARSSPLAFTSNLHKSDSAFGLK
jgi:hypothetical protein